MRVSLALVFVLLGVFLLSVACGHKDCTERKVPIRTHIEHRTRMVEYCVREHKESRAENHYGYHFYWTKPHWRWGWKLTTVWRTVCDEKGLKPENYDETVVDEWSSEPVIPQGCPGAKEPR